MRVTREEQRTVEVIDDVFCDRCGESCRCHVGNILGLHFAVEGAYGSTHFPDVDVCEKCAAQWFATFVRNPLEPEPCDSEGR